MVKSLFKFILVNFLIIIYIYLYYSTQLWFPFLCYSYIIEDPIKLITNAVNAGRVTQIPNILKYCYDNNIEIPKEKLFTILSGNNFLRLLHLNPQIRNWGSTGTCFCLVDCINRTSRLTLMWKETECVWFWNFLETENRNLFHKVLVTFDIDLSDPRFFTGIVHKTHTYDQWWLLFELSEYILKFQRLYIQKNVVGNVIYWRSLGNIWFVDYN